MMFKSAIPLFTIISLVFITVYLNLPKSAKTPSPQNYPKILQNEIYQDMIYAQINTSEEPNVIVCNNLQKYYKIDETSKYGRNCKMFEFIQDEIPTKSLKNARLNSFFQVKLKNLQKNDTKLLNLIQNKNQSINITDVQALPQQTSLKFNLTDFQKQMRRNIENYLQNLLKNQALTRFITAEDIIFQKNNLTKRFSFVFDNTEAFEIKIPMSETPNVQQEQEYSPGIIIQQIALTNQMKFIFALQENEQLYKIIDYVFTDQSPKSLSAFLQKKEFIFDNILTQVKQYPSQLLYEVKLQLTDLGFQRINNIIESFFIFCESLKRKNFENIIDQVVSIQQQKFDYEQNNQDFPYLIGSNLLKYPQSRIFTGDYLLTSVKNQELIKFIDKICIENAYIFIESPNFKFFENQNLNQDDQTQNKEKEGIKYRVQEIKVDLISKIKNSDISFIDNLIFLPKPVENYKQQSALRLNYYKSIPIKPTKTVSYQVSTNQNFRVRAQFLQEFYFRYNYLVPKQSLFMKIKLNYEQESVDTLITNLILKELYDQYHKLHVLEYQNMDYKYKIDVTQSNIYLYFEGYNQYFQSYVQNSLEFFQHKEINLKQFSRSQQKLIDLFYTLPISQLALNYAFLFKQSRNIDLESFQKNIQEFTINKFQTVLINLFQNVNLNLFYNGNVQNTELRKLSSYIKQLFSVQKKINRKLVEKKQFNIKIGDQEALVFELKKDINQKKLKESLIQQFSYLRIQVYVIQVNSIFFQNQVILVINEDKEKTLDKQMIENAILNESFKFQQVSQISDNNIDSLYIRGLQKFKNRRIPEKVLRCIVEIRRQKN